MLMIAYRFNRGVPALKIMRENVECAADAHEQEDHEGYEYKQE